MKDYSVSVLVDLDEIDADLLPARHARVALSEEAIEEYVGILDLMPPVKLVQDRAGHHWVADGCHTISAARHAGRKQIRAIVKRGTWDDAWKDASVANNSHGLRRTNADKRHFVLAALDEPRFQGKSSRAIAELCAVSDRFVGMLRPESGANDSHLDDAARVVGKDGKSYPARKAPSPRQPKEVIPYTQGNPRSSRETPEAPPRKPEASAPWEDDEPAPEGLTRSDVAEMFGAPSETVASPVAETRQEAGVVADEEYDFEGNWARLRREIETTFEGMPEEYQSSLAACLGVLAERLRERSGWVNMEEVTVEIDG